MLFHLGISIGLITLLAFCVARAETSKTHFEVSFCIWQLCLFDGRKNKLVLLIQWLFAIAIHGVLVLSNLPDYNLVTVMVMSAEILVGLLLYALDMAIRLFGGCDDEHMGAS